MDSCRPFVFIFHNDTNPFSRQPSCFHIHTNPRGCGGLAAPAFTNHPSRSTSHVLSYCCRLFVAPKKSTPFAIKQIQTLFAKYRGGVARSGFWTLGGSRRRLPVPEMLLRDTRARGTYRLRPLCSDLSALCVACFQQLAASCSLLPLFFALVSFFFSSLQPLFPKTGGIWGCCQHRHVDLPRQKKRPHLATGPLPRGGLAYLPKR
jgi:hypothetical protein